MNPISSFVLVIFLIYPGNCLGQVDSTSTEPNGFNYYLNQYERSKINKDFRVFKGIDPLRRWYKLSSLSKKSPVNNNQTNLNLNFYFDVFPLEDYYINGRHFMTIEGAYIPPYYIRDKYLIMQKEKKQKGKK